MLSLYKSSERYIERERKFLGWDHAGLQDSQNSRVNHFLDTLRSQPIDLEDATACMEELDQETDHFTKEQRQLMGDAVATCMRHSSASTLSSTSTKQQSCEDLHNMWPESVWSNFFDKNKSYESKKEVAAAHMISVLHLRRPNDNACKSVIATLEKCHGREMDPEEMYKEVRTFREKVSSMRDLPHYKSTAPLQLHIPKVDDFVKLNPGAYRDDDPPIPCRINSVDLVN